MTELRDSLSAVHRALVAPAHHGRAGRASRGDVALVTGWLRSLRPGAADAGPTAASIRTDVSRAARS